jgi:hypothetical protein
LPHRPKKEPGQQCGHQEVHAIMKKCLYQSACFMPKGRRFLLILRP